MLNGGVREVIDMDDIEQQAGPAFSPDGKTIAFSGWRNGQFDIFLLDLATRTITNFTRDEIYDGGPTFSPDGRSLVFVSVIGTGYRKLFREDLDKPGVRYQLTTGKSNENDPGLSRPTASGSTSPRTARGRRTSSASTSPPASSLQYRTW